MSSFLSLAFVLLPLAIAAPSSKPRNADPTIELSYATVIGSSKSGIDTFNGIPFAQPPTGQLRLKPPQPITSNLGILQLPNIPKACPQFPAQIDSEFLPTDVLGLVADTPFGQKIEDAGEDCLTVNVQRPSTTTKDSKLPVVFWMFGGGFEFGASYLYDASDFIRNSISQKKEFIYVAVNYRIGGFGFLPGKEILQDGSANLGHLDQRLGLQWVQDNIAEFGGDPDRVTIWGESAGSISVFNQMSMYDGDYTYKGKKLFRAAIMNSGSTVPADPVDGAKGQAVYDTVVKAAGCSEASDTLACLRQVDYQTFLNAANSVPAIVSYTSVALAYLPRPDGTALTASADILAATGRFAPVPYIIGDQEDEGTLFALPQLNLSTTDELLTYLETFYFPTVDPVLVSDLVRLYPDDPAAGSPFNTGELNNIYPQYKRLAALLGDKVFTLIRRFFLTVSQQVHPGVPTWSYIASYGYGTPVIGTFHASDTLQSFGTLPGFASQTTQDYYISFINDMDPNAGRSDIEWPMWRDGNSLLNFRALENVIITDDFRKAQGEFIGNTTALLLI